MFYLKNPNPHTLLARSNVAQPGYLEMAEADAQAWAAAEIAAGWTPAAQPDPEPEPAVMTPLDLIERLTDPEKVAIFTSSDPGVMVFRSMAMAAQEIRADDPRTLDGLGYLEAIGILAAGRSAELLTP